MSKTKDNRIVMTLDAGGTNFVFNAVQAGREILDPISLSASGSDLNQVLEKIIEGFKMVKFKLVTSPVAISFAFPGPANYEQGIIGDLANLPLFRGGVALGPMLAEKFKVPVFINNDGDLFAYGEAISGLLADVNAELKKRGNPRRYQNLLGVTLGTGFGAGVVSKGKMFAGDNSAPAEINRMRNYDYPNQSIEESVSIRGIRKSFAETAGLAFDETPEPKDIYEIGIGKKPGNKLAAIKAFEKFAIATGDAILSAVTMIDGLTVIGGGLAGAHPLFLHQLTEYLKKPYNNLFGEQITRMEVDIYNLEDPVEREVFFSTIGKKIPVPFSKKNVFYDPVKKVGIGISKLGTSQAVSIGAYAFALRQLAK